MTRLGIDKVSSRPRPEPKLRVFLSLIGDEKLHTFSMPSFYCIWERGNKQIIELCLVHHLRLADENFKSLPVSEILLSDLSLLYIEALNPVPLYNYKRLDDWNIGMITCND